MLKDADPSSFAAIYVVCGFTDMRYGIDSLAAMIESRYASRTNDGTIIKANRPAGVFRNCIATPSLIAALAAGKYFDHLPLERQIQRFRELGLNFGSNTLSNWMINASDQYYSILCDELHSHLLNTPFIHADETPFEVIADDRKPSRSSYMWVYRTGACDPDHPVVIYDYQPTRRTDHP